MGNLIPILLSLGVLATMLLIGAGAAVLWRGEDRKRGWLMIAAGLVTLINIALYLTLPPAAS
jgi:uncharacterized membrane protein YozB (DUF420 family)